MKNNIKLTDFQLVISRLVLFVLVLWVCSHYSAYSQTYITSPAVTTGDVSSPLNMTDGNPLTNSTLTADAGVILGAGGTAATVTFTLPTNFPTNTPVYIRAETTDDLLESLVGGSLGSILNSVVGLILGGEQVVEISCETSAGTTMNLGATDTPTAFANEGLKVLTDMYGQNFFYINPSLPAGVYMTKIKIVNRVSFSILGLGAQKTLKLWDPFYYHPPLGCPRPMYTSYDGTGLNANLLGLGGVQSTKEFAIDGDLTTASSLNLGLLAVGASTTQRFFFDGMLTQGEVVNVRMSSAAGILSLGLLDNLKFKFYNNGSAVGEIPLSTIILSASILGSNLDNGQIVDLPITVPQNATRMDIIFSAFLSVNINKTIKIYEVFKTQNPPEFNTTGSTATICTGNQASLLVSTALASESTFWYTSETATTPIATLANGVAFTTPSLTASTTYYVNSGIIGCPDRSARIAVPVTVNYGPNLSTLNLQAYTPQCAIVEPTIDLQSNIAGAISYYPSSSSTTAIVDGQTNGAITYNLNGTELSFGGMIGNNTSTTIYVGAIDASSGCPSLPNQYYPYTVSVLDEAPPTTANANQSFCVANDPTIADLAMTGTTLQWYTSSSGGTPLASTASLTDGSSYYATATGANCESSQRTVVNVDIDDTAAPTSSSATQTFCESDLPTIATISVNESNINWYSSNGQALTSTTALADGDVVYAKQQGLVCESSDSLAIEISLSSIPDVVGAASQVFCIADQATIADLTVTGSNVTWKDANGNIVPATTVLVDNGKYFATANDQSCQSMNALEVTVSLTEIVSPTTNNAAQSFCIDEYASIEDLSINHSNVVWYENPTGGTALAPSTLLVNGSTYYAAIADQGCESTTRTSVDVTVTTIAIPTTSSVTQVFCESAVPTIADIDVNETAINWYDGNGNLVVPTTLLVNGSTYYAKQQGASCESPDSLAVTVSLTSVSDVTGNSNQVFCDGEQVFVGDLAVTGSNITWVDENGLSIDPNTTVVNNGRYFAIANAQGCESINALEVTVNFTIVSSPTTSNSSQTFCVDDNATIADLQVDNADIVWYEASILGNPLAPSTPLTDGTTYFAANLDQGCESTSRTSVFVTIITVPTPTTLTENQAFCSQVSTTVGDLQVNESNVVWFDSNGNQLANSTPLTQGSYYGRMLNGTCSSSNPLVVNVSIGETLPSEIYGQFEKACFMDTLVYYAPSGMSNYIWSVNGGLVYGGGTTNDNSVTVIWNSQYANSINVTYLSPSGCPQSITEPMAVSLIHCSDLSLTKVVSNKTPNIGEQIYFTITVSNGGYDIFNDLTIQETILSGFTFLSYTTTHGSYSSVTGEWNIPVLGSNEDAYLVIYARVNPTGIYKNVAVITSTGALDDWGGGNNGDEVEIEPGCFTVYNEISPNGDGVNDELIIDCIEYYPNNSLMIYNRYGNVVYNVESYKNDWNGVANTKGVIGKGEPLPEGTYFYLLKVEEGNVETSGWIYLVR